MYVQPFKHLNLYDTPACLGCAHWGMLGAAGASCLRNEGSACLLGFPTHLLQCYMYGSWRTWVGVSLRLLVLSDIVLATLVALHLTPVSKSLSWRFIVS